MTHYPTFENRSLAWLGHRVYQSSGGSMRRISIVVALTIVAIALVARVAVFGHGNRTEAAVASIEPAAASDWNISGQIQQMNGQFWMIQGFSVRVTDATRVTGALPTVGTFARAQGTVGSDGTWQATSIQVGDAAEMSPTATVTPSSLSDASATATPEATDTPTATIVPSTQAPTATSTTSPRTIVVGAANQGSVGQHIGQDNGAARGSRPGTPDKGKNHDQKRNHSD